MQIVVLKMPWKTNHFNKGQKVFVVFMSGNQACKVRGKFRGKSRKVSAWIKWNDKNMHLLNFNKIQISESDFNKILN